MLSRLLFLGANLLSGGWWVTVATKMVRVLEECGLIFTAAGVAGTILVYLLLRKVSATGGPVPLTSHMVMGLGICVAFLVVMLTHTIIDATLVFLGERTVSDHSDD